MSKTDQSEVNTLGFASTTMELQKNFKQVEEIMANFAKSYEHMDLDPFNLVKSSAEWYTALAKDPQKAINANLAFMQKSMELYQQSLTNLLGGTVASDPVIQEDRGDRRFKHEGWAEQPAFNAIKQSYLLTSKWLRDQVQGVEGLDAHTAEKVEFFTERYLDALSPTNFAATNPAVIEKVIETKGANLVHGLKNMLEDLEAGKGELRIRMTDTSAFELGENVATTPGKVVFQNRMFQLIQYTPSTEKVLKRPLLVIPPWINKFYIMDLQPKNSLLKWLVEQGHTVFVVSWVNPDASYADTGFADYVTEGVLEAVNAVERATGESEINMIGYCIGGSLLATSLAYMKAKGDERVKSATFFTTMLDFSDPGELGVFIDEEQICGLEKKMGESGYLDGSQMAGTFNLMRANDLIWSFYINNYLLGNDPRPFDLLYWNSDSTRMPAKMHAWYLRNLYLENNLCKPGGVTIDGVSIDISKVDIPVCFVSAVEDHIAPWKSTYSGAKLFSGDVRFILGGSGHIAGIINPPAAGKYGYRVTDELPADPEAWAAEAAVNEGSWWPEWDRWVKVLDSKEVSARNPGDRGMTIIENAPGSYVKRTLNDVAPVQPAAEPAAEKQEAVKNTAPVQAAANDAQDDLTAIKGIGPKLAGVLNLSGIVTYGQVAELGAEGLKMLLVGIDERYNRYDTSTWPEQAKALMS
ncbi:MAG: class I poly(R)-hydroxyalkanoic acid synthase [Sedimenticola thiotaurini]|uniref:Class I poly(R)-hydroxyalkanoic acid synthase n=1 Tax=Sedimenticola thiotaurini TaxID=1543721 RepID=A0A558D3K3_9GAMM|nr:class I poly(R)-hydroxyalkanoic acid synthase [Sedimenticola sp.]TVT55581.1 MAG: class I poly(R)-hydroxyalkanoic acid synthase [Sedimenticola thiotaurini]